MFTERQLNILRSALIAFDIKNTGLKWWDIEALKSDVEDLIQIERERKRERAKSLRIEKRAAKAT